MSPHIGPRTEPFFFFLQHQPCSNAHEPLGGSWLNGAGTGRNTVFGRIVHAYSCYQSENNSFLCLLKRVIDLIVLNHYILHDNNAVRITCQELFLDFSAIISMIGL